MPKNPFAARLNDDTIRRLEQLAAALNKSKTAVIEIAVEALERTHKIK